MGSRLGKIYQDQLLIMKGSPKNGFLFANEKEFNLFSLFQGCLEEIL